MSQPTDAENGSPRESLSEQVRVRREKLSRIAARGEVPYKNGFKPSLQAATLHRDYDEKTNEELEALAIKGSIAGRVMAIRDFGKAAFVQLRDGTGPMQLFIQKNRLGDEGFARYRELDAGDIIFGEGQLFKTKTGELALQTD